ncbi:uncharacterized protein J8A68_004291 [[Candida] subhashii]|uniref:Ribosomal lysine N-methyltransferase 3 n=1 Tax=[Candida] subhashii TaxID=561895 RepID=A0A8J5UFY2_9ASCO|nr:uncharacterized protein J8A68_004291 [[Candida] subhashii]KAG7662163.1 hypothetical protein J8A68_004291 [[Candida] subhashii]
MSSTASSKVDSLVQWLNENAYWRNDLIIKQSKFGGLGVFHPDNDDQEEDENDPLFLRIPKVNLLSPKNSFIYNLLHEYEPSNPDIIISEGMYALVISVIYEYAQGEKSPWFAYLQSIDFDASEIPICLWDEQDKASLKNTEVDLLNMLNPKELINFYIEVINFAKLNQDIISIPSVLNIENPTPNTIQEKHHDKLLSFGKYIQSVISRAFSVDNYHGLAMVPAADLFNHIEPEYIDGQIKGRENIHFICDGSVCDICGEQACEHEDSDSEEEMDEDLVQQILEEEDDDEMDEDSENEESDDEGHIEEEGEMSDHESGDLEEEEEEPIKEITMEYIQTLEEELLSDEETDQDPEEVSTVSMSDDEESGPIEPIDGPNEDLAKELSDSSKCCDVVLVRPASKEYGSELFNSYGNELSNPYLLQKYGFIAKENPNDTCLLSVQFFKQIKSLKEKVNAQKKQEIEDKLEWLEEIGYEPMSELIAEMHQPEHGHAHQHEHNGNACEDDDCDSGCEDDDCCKESEFDYPESWPLSIRIKFDGECTPQIYAILKLIELKFVHFKHKLLSVKSGRKLKSRIKEMLLQHSEEEIQAYNKRIVNWCQQRIEAYPKKVSGPHEELAKSMIRQEINILTKFIELYK